MIVLALMMLSSIPSESRSDFQMMTSPAYQAFARKGDAMCPARRLRYLHPADLDGMEESFLSTLPSREQRRVARATPDTSNCPPAGASCPAQHTLAAIVRLGLLDGFTQSACSGAG
ncbi:MAG: hypothetical protein E7773_00250 [Sphingomonas sp.]|uniref:hypothetical protein n=1 Tax=Sphingomonas sp. TaxID=28214 RepID=UPI0012099083|nr:hypothetical protein [Sphingomonas sp.]THD38229.1 MAG: hypothetical protein E7773_00250 [Sphingomonas sp.]